MYFLRKNDGFRSVRSAVDGDEQGCRGRIGGQTVRQGQAGNKTKTDEVTFTIHSSIHVREELSSKSRKELRMSKRSAWTSVGSPTFQQNEHKACKYIVK